MLKQSPDLQYTLVLASVNEQIFRDARRTFNGRHYFKQLNDVLLLITWFYQKSPRAQSSRVALNTRIFLLWVILKEDNDTVCCPVSGRYRYPDTWNKNSIFEAPFSVLGKRSISNES